MLYRDDEKENGNYYLGFRLWGLGFRGSVGNLQNDFGMQGNMP